MTPAIKLLQKQKIAHQVLEYEHDPNASSFGLEAAQNLICPLIKYLRHYWRQMAKPTLWQFYLWIVD